MAAWSAQAHTIARDNRNVDGEKKIIKLRVEYVTQASLTVAFEAWALQQHRDRSSKESAVQ